MLAVGLGPPPASITGIKETVVRNFGLVPAAPGEGRLMKGAASPSCCAREARSAA